MQEMECRVLRVVPEVAIPAVVSPEGPTRAQVRSRSIAEAALFEQAAALGFACLPIDKIEKEIAAAMVTRMRTRQGHHIYQSVSHSVLGVPLWLAKRMFPMENIDMEDSNYAMWVFRSFEDLRETFQDLLQKCPCNSLVAGMSRAIMRPSEKAIRVLATIIPPVEISVVRQPRGVDRLYMNFDYVLSDEAGEIHPPKDPDRREKAMSKAMVKEIREQIYSDLKVMAERDMPLSPKFFRQLKMESRALSAQALLNNTYYPGDETKRRSKRQMETFEVERIIEEKGMGCRRRFLVRWAGYRPEWEPWRITGDVGDPIETWEPMSSLRDTEALLAWDTIQGSESQ